jgi:tRNA(fMet)-specific endonuclease VapC
MGVIIDTSALMAAEKQTFDLGRLFAAHPKEGFYIAAITGSELLHGVERAHPTARKKARSAFVESVFASLEVIDFDLSVARVHATLWASLEKSGSMIGPYDLLIAATGLKHDYPLVTLNTAEFERIAGLRLVDSTPYRIERPNERG